MSELQVIDNPINTEWYQALIEDLSATIVEKQFDSRLSLIEMYHEIGNRVNSEIKNFEESGVYGEEITKQVALSIGKSQRVVQLAVQFYKMFPDLLELPDGKSISWTKIVKNYLPAKKETETLSLPPVNVLQDKIIKHSLILAQNSKAGKSGVTMTLPKDLI